MHRTAKAQQRMQLKKWKWERNKKSAEERKSNSENEIAKRTKEVEQILYSSRAHMRKEVKERWAINLFGAVLEVMWALKALKAKNAAEKDIAEANKQINHYTANLYKP